MKAAKAKKRRVRFCPTQKDIADALGFSQSTVAMALNANYEHRLMAETVQRIQKYAAEVGYHPQRSAQIMQGGQTMIIGVIVRLNAYAKSHEMVSLLANEFARAGYRLVQVDLSWFSGDEAAARNYLLDQGVEGIVLCNLVVPIQAQALLDLLPANLPVVSLQSTIDSRPNFRTDVEGAHYELARTHLALGARRLSLLSSFRDVGNIALPAYTVRLRALGFARAIQKAGGVVVSDQTSREILEIPGCRLPSEVRSESLVGTILYPEREPHIRNAFEHGFNQTRKMIGDATLPDALICANDDSAIGALAACADGGIQVPETLRISGHDDTMPGRFGFVPLTSVRAPLEALAKQTAELLVAAIENRDEPLKPESVYLPCDVMIRGSSGTVAELRQLAKTSGPGDKARLHIEWERSEERTGFTTGLETEIIH